MLRVTADTNVLISGLVFQRGKPFQLLELARDGVIRLHISEPILAEVEDVLSRKFGFSTGDAAEARRQLEAIARTVIPAVELDVIQEDPADNRVLECAVAGGSDCIVTGDKDLLRLGGYDAIRILTVADFLAEMPEAR